MIDLVPDCGSDIYSGSDLRADLFRQFQKALNRSAENKCSIHTHLLTAHATHAHHAHYLLHILITATFI